MATVEGLSPLAPVNGVNVQYDDRPEATPEARYGGPADPRHASIGEQAKPYSWQSSIAMSGSHGPYGPENQMLGDADWVWQGAGDVHEDPYMDRTPSRRAAPWPKGIASGPVPGETPGAIANQLIQGANIRGTNLGASAKMKTTQQGDAQQDEWQEIWEVNPGHVDQENLPAQYKSSGFMFGTTDRVQSFARQNGYGFDSKHMHRRFATGAIPGNTLWMRPGGRPMVKHIPGTARLPIGPQSPFEADDTRFDFSPDGALLMDQPSEYIPPPQPYMAPSVQSADYGDSAVEWY